MPNSINEVCRIVADFSNFLTDSTKARAVYPISQETRLFIAGDQQEDGSISYSLIGGAEWAYSLVRDLCQFRAIEAEFGRLLVDGQRLPAERYIGMWRDAMHSPMPVDQLIARGLMPIKDLVLPTSECEKERETAPGHVAAWYASPYLVSRDDTISAWAIPLDRQENLELAAELSRVYWSQNMSRPEFCKQVRLDVRRPAARAATGLPGDVHHDLFAEAA